MSSRIDSGIIRNSAGQDLAEYFLSLKDVSTEEISTHLLSAIDSDSLPPRIFSVWLTCRADGLALYNALQYEGSVGLRKAAIKELGRRLSTAKFEETWKAVHGAEGIINLLASFSPSHVKYTCRVLARTSTVLVGREDRRSSMDKLLLGLLADPRSKVSNPDRRLLRRLYEKLLPACSPELVLELHQSFTFKMGQMLQAHYVIFQKQGLDYLQHKAETDRSIENTIELLVTKYPDATLPGNYESESMRFALEVLRVHRNSSDREDNPLLNTTIVSVVRRARRRKMPTPVRVGVLEKVTETARSNPTCFKNVYMTSDIDRDVVQLWGLDPESYDTVLQSLFGFIRTHALHILAADIPNLLSRVRIGLRWRLFKLCMEGLKEFELDTEQEGLKKLSFTWPVKLFLVLPQARALHLLQRVEELHPLKDLLQTSNPQLSRDSIFSAASDEKNTLLNVYLSRNVDEGLALAEESLERLKSMVAATPNREERAAAARKPILIAAASGSQDLVLRTWQWARRFNKDPLTVKQLYSKGVVDSDEAIALLSGLPDNFNYSFDAGAVTREVRQGNEIILFLMQTACMAVKEPDFQANHWGQVLGLCAKVTAERLERTKRSSVNPHISDDMLWDSVYKDTLALTLEVEKIGLDENNWSLQLDRLHGPLWFKANSGSASHLVAERKCVSRFFDELARARDQLWQDYRRNLHPAIVTLSSPWPRGLPIQSLLPDCEGVFGYREDMPYLTLRAEAVVFADPAVVLQSPPRDEEVLTAIGPFVDCYSPALRFYVNGYLEEAQRKLAIEKAWNYACNQLTGTRMDQVEALLFWRQKFESFLDVEPPSFESLLPKSYEPVIPEVEDPCEATEWNPDPDRTPRVTESRELSLTCLDGMINKEHPLTRFRGSYTMWKDDDSSDGNAWFEKSNTVMITEKSYWNRFHLAGVPPRNQEACVIIAALYINSKCRTRKRLLSQPFPSASDVRFPALFLEGQFLDRKNSNSSLGETMLWQLLNVVPPSLVLELYKSVREASDLTGDKNPSIEKTAFTLLEILAAGDKPHLALDPATEVILDRPDSSSWHRRFLNNGFLKRLPVDHVKRFLNGLVLEIERRQLNAQQQPASNRSDPAIPRPKSVKITTMKAVAEVMSKPVFVDEDSMIYWLAGLFTSCTHADSRVVVIYSFQMILQESTKASTHEKIIGFLENHVIDVAASPNQHDALTEEDWQQAEIACKAPEVDHSGSASRGPPLVEALQTFSSQTPASIQKAVVDRILLPILDLSIKNNTRWTRIFLKENNLPALPELPDVPLWRFLLGHLVRDHTSRVPPRILDLWAEAAILNLPLPGVLQQVRALIEQSAQLRESNQGIHFLSLWNDLGSRGRYCNVFVVRLLYDDHLVHSVDDRISQVQIGEIVMRFWRNLVGGGTNTFSVQKRFLNEFEPEWSTKKWWYQWQSRVRPLLEPVIAHVENLKTQEWQTNPSRNPSVLQRDMYEMKLWLMSYPFHDTQPEQHMLRLDTFAAEISEEINALASIPNRPYHTRFRTLKDAARKAYKSDYCYLASKLGSLETVDLDSPALADFLRIELADEMFRAASIPHNASHRLTARAVLSSWCGCRVEDFRMIGKDTTEYLAAKGRGDNWFVTEA